MAINTIVFDLGKVLIKWDPRNLYRKIFSDADRMEWFLREICPLEWNEQMDNGKQFAEACEELVLIHPDLESEIYAYWERWEEMLDGEIEGSVLLFAELKEAGFRTAALSNWSAETFPIAQRHFGFLNWFDLRVISGVHCLIKPDPAIYELLMNELDQPPQELLFIDDSEKNIQAARALGIDSIHFENPDQLRKELVKRDVLAE